MDISNKTLAMFLVAAIVVSIAGTTISLNRLGASPASDGPTGLILGNVTLSVGENLAIVLDTNLIDFGNCTPAASGDVVLNSNLTYGNATGAQGAAQGVCTGPDGGDGNTPANITVRNSGNVDVNVSLNSTKCSEDSGSCTVEFLNSSISQDTSYISYFVMNDSWTGSNSGGCTGTMTAGPTDIDQEDIFYPICDRLQVNPSANSVSIGVLVNLPQGTTGGDTITFDIWAKKRT